MHKLLWVVLSAAVVCGCQNPSDDMETVVVETKPISGMSADSFPSQMPLNPGAEDTVLFGFYTDETRPLAANQPKFKKAENPQTRKEIAARVEKLAQRKTPWRKTESSVAFCEKPAARACVRGYEEVTVRADGDDFVRYEYTTVKCKKGFLPTGDCQAGYSVTKTGAGVEETLSCTRYANGQCIGNYQSERVDKDMRCLPQPSVKLSIEKSEAGVWSYSEMSAGCGDTNYLVICKQFDPQTLICQSGSYEESSECEYADGAIFMGDGPVSSDCVPYGDLYSCEIKDGACMRTKVLKGSMSRGQKSAPGKTSFRLKRPAGYAFK